MKYSDPELPKFNIMTDLLVQNDPLLQTKKEAIEAAGGEFIEWEDEDEERGGLMVGFEPQRSIDSARVYRGVLEEFIEHLYPTEIYEHSYTFSEEVNITKEQRNKLVVLFDDLATKNGWLVSVTGREQLNIQDGSGDMLCDIPHEGDRIQITGSTNGEPMVWYHLHDDSGNEVSLRIEKNEGKGYDIIGEIISDETDWQSSLNSIFNARKIMIEALHEILPPQKQLRLG